MFVYQYKPQPLRHFPRENEKFIVYKHTNKINGKCYVGQTSKSMEYRWRDHVRNSQKGSKLKFHRAIKKYGINNWTHEILEELQSELFCNASEIYWIDFYRSADPKHGYNLTYGGDGGQRPNAETREKQSEVHKGENNSMFGKQHSEETKRKMSEARKGKKQSPETIAKRNESNRGKKRSEEHRQKMSESAKIAQNRPEVRKRKSESGKGKSRNKGKKMTLEQLLHYRETRRRNRELKNVQAVID